jgi:hypothetical protein
VQPAPGSQGELVIVKRRRGRPRKIEPAPPPSISQAEYGERSLAARAAFIEQDPLVQAVGRRAETSEVLELVGRAIAEEVASLAYLEEEDVKRGRDVAQVASRRCDGLRKLSAVHAALHVCSDDVPDLKSEAMQRAFKVWVETAMDVLASSLPAHQLDLVINRLTVEMSSFEDKAADALR